MEGGWRAGSASEERVGQGPAAIGWLEVGLPDEPGRGHPGNETRSAGNCEGPNEEQLQRTEFLSLSSCVTEG